MMTRRIAFVAAPPTPDPFPDRSARPRVRWRRVLAMAAALALAAVIVTAVPGHAATGPVSSANARWLDATYSQLLGRSADDGGLDHHLAYITAGGSESRQDLAYNVLYSVEGSRAEVRGAYTELLGRNADAVGATYWTNHLSNHGVLDLRVLLMAGDEFRLRSGGTDDAWITALYSQVLGRSPEAEGRAYWLGLAQVGLPRAAIAGAIYQSDEALGRRADTYYLDLLGRAPTSFERAESVELVRRHGERYLRARIWASDESFESYLDAAWS